MTDIRAIIFDLDGVICSTDRYHYLAWKALADQLGIPFDEQKNKLLRGVSRMNISSMPLQTEHKSPGPNRTRKYSSWLLPYWAYPRSRPS